MKIRFNIKWILLTGAIFLVVFSSCKDPYADSTAKENAKIKDYVSKGNFTKLPVGVYIEFLNDTELTQRNTPAAGQTIVVNYTGEYLGGSVFETSDSSLGTGLFPNRYCVYGPNRIRLGYTMFGFDTAMKYVSPGDSVIIVIPSDLAWHDNPVVYHVGLSSIIENDTTNEELQFTKFFQANNFNTNNKFTSSSDTLNTFGYGIYWKVISDTTDSLNPSPFAFDEKDSAIIELTARFAEQYYSTTTGRVFYPLAGAPEELKRSFEGPYYFPFVPAIDSALKHMNVGDEMELMALSDYAYGTSGYNDPNTNIMIVPPFMPVYYRVKLLEVRNH